MARRRRRAGALGLSLALCLSLASARAARDTEAGAGGPAPRTADEADDEARAVESEVYRDIVAPFLRDFSARRAADAGDLSAVRTPLRALAGRIHDAVAMRLRSEVEDRAPVRRSVHERVRAAMKQSGYAPALIALFDEAVAADLDARRQDLWSMIMCWCPKEKWTRTLSGCPDACADEQKGMVRQWLDEGRTEDEIVELMVAHPKGGEKVRGYLKPTGVNRLGYALPFLFFGLAVVVAGCFLYRVTARRDRGEDPARGARPGSGPQPSHAADDETRWGDLVEKELREMDS